MEKHTREGFEQELEQKKQEMITQAHGEALDDNAQIDSLSEQLYKLTGEAQIPEDATPKSIQRPYCPSTSDYRAGTFVFQGMSVPPPPLPFPLKELNENNAEEYHKMSRQGLTKTKEAVLTMVQSGRFNIDEKSIADVRNVYASEWGTLCIDTDECTYLVSSDMKSVFRDTNPDSAGQVYRVRLTEEEVDNFLKRYKPMMLAFLWGEARNQRK